VTIRRRNQRPKACCLSVPETSGIWPICPPIPAWYVRKLEVLTWAESIDDFRSLWSSDPHRQRDMRIAGCQNKRRYRLIGPYETLCWQFTTLSFCRLQDHNARSGGSRTSPVPVLNDRKHAHLQYMTIMHVYDNT